MAQSYADERNREKDLSLTSDLPSCFERPSSIDGAVWMTLGDGKFGSDAYFLESHGLDVTATSISTHTLEIARAKGYIRNTRPKTPKHFL